MKEKKEKNRNRKEKRPQDSGVVNESSVVIWPVTDAVPWIPNFLKQNIISIGRGQWECRNDAKCKVYVNTTGNCNVIRVLGAVIDVRKIEGTRWIGLP